MKIRKFEEKDLEQAIELCREIREHHREVLNGYFMPLDDNFEKRALLASLKDENLLVWVADNEGEIVGLLISEKRMLPYLEQQSRVNVETLGVKKSFRKQGIGRKMMDVLYEYCQDNGVAEIKLGVFNKNTSAYKFYEKYGFKPLEQRMNLFIKE